MEKFEHNHNLYLSPTAKQQQKPIRKDSDSKSLIAIPEDICAQDIGMNQEVPKVTEEDGPMG